MTQAEYDDVKGIWEELDSLGVPDMVQDAVTKQWTAKVKNAALKKCGLEYPEEEQKKDRQKLVRMSDVLEILMHLEDVSMLAAADPAWAAVPGAAFNLATGLEQKVSFVARKLLAFRETWEAIEKEYQDLKPDLVMAWEAISPFLDFKKLGDDLLNLDLRKLAADAVGIVAGGAKAVQALASAVGALAVVHLGDVLEKEQVIAEVKQKMTTREMFVAALRDRALPQGTQSRIRAWKESRL